MVPAIIVWHCTFLYADSNISVNFYNIFVKFHSKYFQEVTTSTSPNNFTLLFRTNRKNLTGRLQTEMCHIKQKFQTPLECTTHLSKNNLLKLWCRMSLNAVSITSTYLFLAGNNFSYKHKRTYKYFWLLPKLSFTHFYWMFSLACTPIPHN